MTFNSLLAFEESDLDFSPLVVMRITERSRASDTHAAGSIASTLLSAVSRSVGNKPLHEVPVFPSCLSSFIHSLLPAKGPRRHAVLVFFAFAFGSHHMHPRETSCAHHVTFCFQGIPSPPMLLVGVPS